MRINIDRYLEGVGKWDVYPGVSTVYSGPIRILSSAVQLVVGSIFCMIVLTAGRLTDKENWKNDFDVNFKEVRCGLYNLIRGVIALIPLFGNALIYFYRDSGPIVLKRDEDGLYTFPDVKIDNLNIKRPMRGDEIKLKIGDFEIDTARGVMPKGWVLQA